MPPTIYISNDLYNIICLLFSSDLIHGRAMLCFIVMKAPMKQDKQDGNSKQYIVKSSWAHIGQSNTEEEMLNWIKERGLTYGVPNLIVAWMVQIGGVDNSTDLCWPDYIQSHLSEDQWPEVQVQHWILLNPVGMPLESFSCIQELLSVLIDIIDGKYHSCYASQGC